MTAFLAGLACGATAGLLLAALCQIAREADERPKRIDRTAQWQGETLVVRTNCRHCYGEHLDTECDSPVVKSVDANAMEVVIGGWPRPFGSRRVWRQRPVA